jgi:hypothetical protein
LIQLKQQLYNLCLDYINQRIVNAEKVIEGAQNSANDETKSSAGDKYETGRTMMQQEAQWGRTQLAEAQKLKQDLDQIKPDGVSDIVLAGSLVHTNKGVFYIAISAGRLQVEKETVFAISAISPLGAKLLGQKAGAGFDLNGQTYSILKVQ